MTGASPPATVTAALADLAASRPDHHAISVDGDDDLTFADWERRSDALAVDLARRGVAAGDPVALRFDAPRWAEYAVAYVAVLKAGAVAVLIPAGLAAADAARILRHSGATILLGDTHLTPPNRQELGTERRTELLSEPGGGVTELVYPLSPAARPRPLPRTQADVMGPPRLGSPGWLVHAWAPGSLAGQHALADVLAGAVSAATLARFSAEAFLALVDRLQAATCGLTPGLARALVGSGAAARTSGDAVASLVLSSPAGVQVRDGLASVFPRAAVVDLGPGEPTAGGDPAPPPVGASQLGMLWHEQLAPGSFNLPSLVRRYRGRLAVPALERALAELVRRHEPLRTTFEVGAGVPRQVVRPSAFHLPVVDLAGLGPGAGEVEAARIASDATSEPFDLVDGPLFAPRLVRLGDDDHVLVVRLHHTAFDDWSVDVFRRELSALYTAFLAGQPSPLSEPTTRFVDVCRQQQGRLDGPEGEAERAAVRHRMGGSPFAAQLPLGQAGDIGPDRPRAGEPLSHDLPAGLAREVVALAPRLRATPFMTMLAAFGLLVGRRTGQDDLVVATVVAGRGTRASEGMIGCFTRKVLLRLRLDGDPTFTELVARTRAAVLDAMASQHLPFEAVVQEALGRPAAAHGVVPQVPIVFQGETPQLARLVLPGLDVGPFEMPMSARRERHFSAAPDGDDASSGPVWGDGAYCGTFLLLSLLVSEGGLSLVARGVFSRPEAQRLLGDLEDLLAAVVAAPDRRLSELAPPPSRDLDPDQLRVRGLRLRRSRLEAALRRCPGVAEAAVAPAGPDGDLVAYVVADRDPPPSLAQLRAALWTALPGSPWPAAAVLVDRLPRLRDGRLETASIPSSASHANDEPDPRAALLTSLWSEAGARDRSPSESYWQDLSFLRALAEARAAGLPITDEQVSHCRTPEMLAAALAADPPLVEPS